MKVYTLSIVTVFIAILALISFDEIPYRDMGDVIEWGTIWSVFYIGVMVCFLVGYHLLDKVKRSEAGHLFAIIKIIIVWQIMPALLYAAGLAVHVIGKKFGVYLFYGDAGLSLLVFWVVAYIIDGIIGIGFIIRMLSFKSHIKKEGDAPVN